MISDSAASPLTFDTLKMVEDRTSCLKRASVTESQRTSLTSVETLEQDLWGILSLDDSLTSNEEEKAAPASPASAPRCSSMDMSVSSAPAAVVPTRRASSSIIAPRRPSIKRTSTTGSSRRSSAPSLKIKRSVSFDKVKVREFQQVLGENPPLEGPSISLGWNYNEKKELDLEKFESKRNAVSLFRKGRRDASKESLTLSPSKREKLARKLGYTQEEIEKNMRQVQRCQQRRKQTLKEIERGAVQDPMEIFLAAQKFHGRSFK